MIDNRLKSEQVIKSIYPENSSHLMLKQVYIEKKNIPMIALQV